MIGLVLVTHGRLAAEFVTAMEHVVGPQEAIEAICIGPDEGARKVMPVHAAVAAAREAGRKYISVASEILGEAAA